MFNYETDDFFVNINLKNEISEKLLDYQFLHIFNLITALRSNNVVLDGSDTGTGKTYCAIALCKQLNLRPFIICPKSVMSTWRNVSKYFGVNPLGIVNYETVKMGKYYDLKTNERIDCKYIEVSQLDEKNINFKWNLPRYSLLIFDEVHKCKNLKSQNGKLLLSSKDNKFQKILMISATVSDKPDYFHIYGYMLDFYKNIKQGNNWIKGMLIEDKTYIGSIDKLSAINRKIYPNKGSRIRIKELGSKFPSNQITAEAYDIDNNKKSIINQAFKSLNELQIKSNLENNKNGEILAEITKARMLIEEAKISIIEELANDYIENGYSVAIFVNFNKTIDQLSQKLNTKCIIRGDVNETQREKNVTDFQENKEEIIILNNAITNGISLHDQHGKPRVSLISPSFNTTDFIQVLGRICRAGAKTPALQRIIYCADTCEEVICKRLKDNLSFLSKLNDNDLIKIE